MLSVFGFRMFSPEIVMLRSVEERETPLAPSGVGSGCFSRLQEANTTTNAIRKKYLFI